MCHIVYYRYTQCQHLHRSKDISECEYKGYVDGSFYTAIICFKPDPCRGEEELVESVDAWCPRKEYKKAEQEHKKREKKERNGKEERERKDRGEEMLRRLISSSRAK